MLVEYSRIMQLITLWRLLIFFIIGDEQAIFVVSRVSAQLKDGFTVATYNIWNIMFHWEVRKYHIAEMVS